MNIDPHDLRRRFIRCIPLLLAVLVYGNALGGSFHFDDGHAVVENPAIRSLANVGRFFVDPSAFSMLPQNQSYRPLLLLTYALTATVAGVTPRAFLVVNLAVHLLCVLLFARVLRRALRVLGYPEDERLVWLSSALFAVHPLFSECVNYVSARSESLCAAFSLLALASYLRGREQGGLRPVLLAGIATAAAMLVKPVAVAVPLFALVFEAAAAERRPGVLGRIAALLVPALLLGWLSGHMTPTLAITSASEYTRLEYIRAELPVLLYYLGLFAWPVDQSADHVYPAAQSFFEPRVLLALCALGLLCAFIVRALVKRRYHGIAVALALCMIGLLPSSSLFPLAELVNERRPYLPAAALCPVLAALLLYGAPRLLQLEGAWRTRVAFGLSGLALLVFASTTVARNRIWHDEASLWRDVVAKAPNSARAQMNYGLCMMRLGRDPEAETYLRAAVQLAPYYAYARINWGLWLLRQHREDEARKELDRAVELGPDLVYAYYHRGVAAEAFGEPPELRVKYLRRATELSPGYVEAQYQLARALAAASRFEEAERVARTVVALRGSYEDRFLLTVFLIGRGAGQEAAPMVAALLRENRGDRRKVLQDLGFVETRAGVARSVGP